jgi:hypothetical protein
LKCLMHSSGASGVIWFLLREQWRRQVFSTFLACQKTAITSASYYGAAIPGRLCPTFAYHLTVGECWPTHLNPLQDLIKDPLVIDLYMKNHPVLMLITKDQLSTKTNLRGPPPSRQQQSHPPCPRESNGFLSSPS